MSTGFLNGAWAPVADLRVSVLDRGFLFGDGLYEVVPVLDGALVAPERHYARMQRTAAALNMVLDDDCAEWLDILRTLLQHNPDAGGLYYQVSRGADAQRGHIPSGSAVATRFAMALALSPQAQQPVRAELREDLRWHRCDLKTTSLLGHIFASLQGGAGDVIFVRDGLVTEAVSSNVYVVSGGRVTTPVANQHILAGITRELLMEASSGTDWAVTEGEVSRQDLLDADEVWLSSSMRHLVPVVEIDGSPVGDGAVGALWQRAHSALLEHYLKESA